MPGEAGSEAARDPGLAAESPPQIEPSPAPSRGAKARLRAVTTGLPERLGLVGVWVVVVIVFSILKPETYPTISNFSSIFGSQAPLMVVTLGLLLPLTAGDFDLSIASELSLAAMTVAILNVNDHWNIGYAVLAGVGTGVAVGLVNGLLITWLELDSFIVTLGMATFIEGIVFWISHSATISGVSPALVNWTTSDFLSIPLEFWYALGGVVLLGLVFDFTTWGRRLLFVGKGRDVARLSGIHVRRMRASAFLISGIVAALAGVLYAGTTGSADPSSGQTFLLPAFAAAFLGTTTIQPGRFNPWGAFVAVYVLVSGITGLELFGFPTFVQQLFYGGALVVAIASARILSRRRLAEQ